MAAVPHVGQGTVQLTPLSNMAARMALAKARAGTPVAQAFQEANEALSGHFLLGDLLSPTQSSDQTDLELILSGLNQFAFDTDIEPSSLREALALDIIDGRFDGRENGNTLFVRGNIAAQGQSTRQLLSTAATFHLASSIQSYQN